jgi:Cu/Ag efflux protein CusF
MWQLAVASLLLAGCAGYELQPLAANHPAHPEAPVAPEPAPSQTLAYSRADIPLVQPASRVTAAPHERHGSRATETEGAPTVVGEGEVIAAMPTASQIVVEHGEIQGFMEAMTMGYRVDPASLLAGLKSGDKVRFTIDVQRRAIIGIEKLQ